MRTRSLARLGAPLVLLAVWALVFAVEMPLRQAFVNGVIPSEQRATVLSFDNVMASAGGVVIQPGLGRLADLYGYPGLVRRLSGHQRVGSAVRRVGAA